MYSASVSPPFSDTQYHPLTLIAIPTKQCYQNVINLRKRTAPGDPGAVLIFCSHAKYRRYILSLLHDLLICGHDDPFAAGGHIGLIESLLQSIQKRDLLYELVNSVHVKTRHHPRNRHITVLILSRHKEIVVVDLPTILSNSGGWETIDTGI